MATAKRKTWLVAHIVILLDNTGLTSQERTSLVLSCVTASSYTSLTPATGRSSGGYWASQLCASVYTGFLVSWSILVLELTWICSGALALDVDPSRKLLLPRPHSCIWGQVSFGLPGHLRPAITSPLPPAWNLALLLSSTLGQRRAVEIRSGRQIH